MDIKLLAIGVLVGIRLMSSELLIGADDPTPSVDHLIKDNYLSRINSPTNDPTPRTHPNNSDKQSQMAAWLLDSKRIANHYVSAIDKELYLQSWTEGDQLFQHTISKDDWVKGLSRNRKPLGHVISRKFKDQRLAMDPQGLPKGAYMVVEYETFFDREPISLELLTLRQGDDGVWRVLTYQLN